MLPLLFPLPPTLVPPPQRKGTNAALIPRKKNVFSDHAFAAATKPALDNNQKTDFIILKYLFMHMEGLMTIPLNELKCVKTASVVLPGR